jgi:lipopolysaccharide transport system ATP-binding protein
VIFISHDLAAVSSLCNRCIVLDAGKVAFDGPTSGYPRYASSLLARTGSRRRARGRRCGCALGRAEIVDEAGRPVIEAGIASPVRVRMRYWQSGKLAAPSVPNFHFYRADGICAFVSVPAEAPPEGRGDYVAEVTIPGNFLNEGMYTIGVALTTFLRGQLTTHFYERGALVLNVRDPREPGGLRHGIGYAGDFPGVVRPHFAWTIARARE